MDERNLLGFIEQVKVGRLSRRVFVQRMVALGLSAPMAGLMLAGNGVAVAVSSSSAVSRKRRERLCTVSRRMRVTAYQASMVLGWVSSGRLE